VNIRAEQEIEIAVRHAEYQNMTLIAMVGILGIDLGSRDATRAGRERHRMEWLSMRL